MPGQKTIAIANDINCCVGSVPVQLLKTKAAAASVPEAITATRNYFRQAILIGKKALAGTDNASAVYLGFSSAAAEQPIVIDPNGTYVLAPANGEKWNLADLYLDTDADGDGVVIIYS